MKMKINLLSQRYIINGCKKKESLYLYKTVRRVKKKKIPVKEFKFATRKAKKIKRKKKKTLKISAESNEM